MSSRDLLIIAVAGVGTFWWIQDQKRQEEEIAALRVRNAALQAAQKKKKRGTNWTEVALGAIPIVGDVVVAFIRA
jgi:type II secretory pathway pseudopilin PulG